MAVLNYQQIGAGPNLILIHGLFGSLENLNMVAKNLAVDHQVTSLDVRNHGASFHQNSMEYSALANDVIDTLKALSIDKAAFLGHSMGGKIAMQVALDFPQVVDKLIVADIAPVNYSPHHQDIIAGLLSLNFTELDQRSAIDIALSSYVSDLSTRQFLLRNLVKKHDKFSFKCNLQNISAAYPQIIKGLVTDKRFNGETLFIKGGKSDYILAEHRATIKQLFPLSTAKIIQQAGHWLHAEKPTIFNKIVRDFLAK